MSQFFKNSFNDSLTILFSAMVSKNHETFRYMCMILKKKITLQRFLDYFFFKIIQG